MVPPDVVVVAHVASSSGGGVLSRHEEVEGEVLPRVVKSQVLEIRCPGIPDTFFGAQVILFGMWTPEILRKGSLRAELNVNIFSVFVGAFLHCEIYCLIEFMLQEEYEKTASATQDTTWRNLTRN